MALRQTGTTSVGDYSVILCPQTDLDLEHTLASGQAFRWHRDDEGWWSAVIGPAPVILRCWQDREQLYYQTYPKRDDLGAVRAYFQLDIDLAGLTRSWPDSAGGTISRATDRFAGLRVTCQDPVECLFSFLCSSVAPIYRIRRMLETICRTLGAKVAEIAGREYYSFPDIEQMASAGRTLYDKMGCGFRGANLRDTSIEICRRGGREYLVGLRDQSYEDAKNALMSLPGVGAKIADCVCLFSLAKQDAVPLDVHMTRVAKQLFPPARAMKTLTPRAYNEIADLFRRRFGDHAGWAQQYLFYNELIETGAWDREMGVHVPGSNRGRG